MTGVIRNPSDDARYLPTPYHGPVLEGSVDTYRAPCEVCGADCDWTVHHPQGLCPCTDLEENAA